MGINYEHDDTEFLESPERPDTLPYSIKSQILDYYFYSRLQEAAS